MYTGDVYFGEYDISMMLPFSLWSKLVALMYVLPLLYLVLHAQKVDFTIVTSFSACKETISMECHNPVYSETSLIHTSDIQFPHLPQKFLLEQIYSTPTVHYATAPSFIQFLRFICNFIHNGCVQISEV